MRKLVIAVIGVVGCALVGLSLVGCGDAEEPVANPESDTPAESTRWTQEEQAAIDAVEAYLTAWSEISQDLGGQDWERIREYAAPQIADVAIEQWGMLDSQGFTVVGSLSSEIQSIEPVEGKESIVSIRACVSGEDAYIALPNGEPVDPDDPGRSLITIFTATQQQQGHFFLLTREDLNETC